MLRPIILVAAVAALLPGCANPAAPAPPPVPAAAPVASSAVGRWSLLSVDGKPLPKGASLDLEYRPDGELVFDRRGDAPTLDQAKLKQAFDAMAIPGTALTTATVAIDGLRLSLEKTPGTGATRPR
jgi:hypothetical protein